MNRSNISEILSKIKNPWLKSKKVIIVQKYENLYKNIEKIEKIQKKKS